MPKKKQRGPAKPSAAAPNAATPGHRPRYRQRRQARSRRGLIIGGTVGVLVLLLIGVTIQTSGGGGNFEISAYQGASQLGGSTAEFEQVKLKARAEGKPIVLNFWGGPCPPCRAEMPGFQRAYERNADDFLMIGLDVGPFFGLGTRQSALALLDDLGITYPAAFALNRDPIASFGATALPSTFFFDAEGTLVSRVIGFIDEQRFEREIQLLLAGPVATGLLEE